ncbi:PDZ domain-containing protein [bacterium]|nr:MAG: PDZ domain-containing protein [bacterium]
MFSPCRLVLGSLLVATAATPVFAVPTASSVSALKYDFADEDLEARWSWRGAATLPVGGEIGVAIGYKDAANSGYLSLKNDGKALNVVLQSVKGGAATVVGTSSAPAQAKGELGLQKVGNRVRVTWNGQVVASGQIAAPGAQFGTATKDGAQIEGDTPQPTETVVFRDDFMRAEGPEDQENPSEWKVAGIWKTSGSLGPKSDAALNPNPFVFRAQGASSAARAGKWWWSDYSVSTSMRATRKDTSAPLIAGIEAFSDGNGGGLRGEIDFSRGVATLKDGSKVLATSAAFDTQPGQWHRLRIEPGPGTARFFVDGILRASAPAQRVQGSVVLRATAGAANFVDFDDVRVGNLQNGHEWGEGALPERFQKDRLMRNWASDAGAWKRDAKGTYWHTGDFFGAAQLKVALPVLKPGQGFEIIFAGNPQNEQSGIRYEITRPGEKKELVGRLKNGEATKAAPQVFMATAAEMPLALNFTPLNSASASLNGILGGTKIERKSIIPVPLFVRGTKLGIRPLQSGKPLPPPALQKVTVASATYERENRTMIGINFTPVTQDLAHHLGLPDGLGAAVDNVEDQSPAKSAGVREGDVIRSVEGSRITDVESMRTIVGGVKPGAVIKLEILRPQADASGLNWENASATAPSVLDYSFTAAPVDWQSARGTWDIAERWTCSPQWSFFAGQDDASPLLWSRFATKGDWTLEAYLASPMDLARGERSPTDLNITVGGDGVDLSSGYSFIFGGNARSVNQIRRGDAVAWEKPFVMPPGVGETHQDWFYVRLERRQTPQGARFRYSVNGRELANYIDPKPLADGGHIGFWTLNGGLSIARVRLWNAGLRVPEAGKPFSGATLSQPTITNALGNWSTRGQGSDVSARIIPASLGAEPPKPTPQALMITNPRSGGDWTTYVTRKAFNTALIPTLEWDYKVGQGVKVNLYALVDDSWREIVFTGDATSTDESDVNQLGRVTITPGQGEWKHARFDIAKALRLKGIGGTVESLAFAAPDQDYLRAGLGGNHRGATYWISKFRAGK